MNALSLSAPLLSPITPSLQANAVTAIAPVAFAAAAEAELPLPQSQALPVASASIHLLHHLQPTTAALTKLISTSKKEHQQQLLQQQQMLQQQILQQQGLWPPAQTEASSDLIVESMDMDARDGESAIDGDMMMASGGSYSGAAGETSVRGEVGDMAALDGSGSAAAQDMDAGEDSASVGVEASA